MEVESTYQVCVFLAGEDDSGGVVEGGISCTFCRAGKINHHLVESENKT